MMHKGSCFILFGVLSPSFAFNYAPQRFHDKFITAKPTHNALIRVNGNESRKTSLIGMAPPKKSDENLQENTTERKIIGLAVPALTSLAIDPLMTVVDTAFVGRYSENSFALAGMGSASALLTFSFYLFNFLTVSTAPLVSTRRASGDVKSALLISGQSLTLAIVLGGILTAILIAFSPDLLGIMGVDMAGQEANSYAFSFLTVRALASPAVLICSSSVGVLRGFFDTKTPVIVLAFANLINFMLDVILISKFHMGPEGAAIATTTAEWISAILFLGVLAGVFPSASGNVGSNYDQEKSKESQQTNKETSLKITPTFSTPEWEEVKPLIVASSSAFIRSAAIQITLGGAAAMAARSGSDMLADSSSSSAPSLAAHQIAIQLFLLCSFVCDALAAASQTLVSDAVGRDDRLEVRNVSRTVFKYALGLGVVLSGVLAFGKSNNFLLDFFTTDKATKEALAPILSLIILSQPLNSLVFTADGVLQGASEFVFQAKSVSLSAVVAIGTFFFLETTNIVALQDGLTTSPTLLHVWIGLVVLIGMRGITAFLKICDSTGPIDILDKRDVTQS